MLEIVEKVNFATGGFGCKNVLTLRHVPSLIDLSLVVNLDVQTHSRLLSSSNAIARFALFVERIVPVIFSVFRRLQWDFNLNLNCSENMNLDLRSLFTNSSARRSKCGSLSIAFELCGRLRRVCIDY